MRKIINFMIMLFLAAVLIGCGVEDSIKKLDAPVIKTVQHNIVYWGSVDNAGSYVVNIDDIFEQQTTDLNFDLGKVLSESKSGIVKVKAKGNGNNFIDSDWSNAFVYEFVKDNGENNNQETEKQKLATPVITGYANETVTWNAVENASGYVVRVNGVEYNVYTTSYKVSFNESCTFTVQVKAIPNTGSEKYLDSEWSNINTYQFVKDNSGNNNQETQKQKLATPVITGYANETVTWNAVENASGYVVRINGVEYNVYNTTYVITFDSSCTFTVQVKAIPNTGSEKYLDSEWSNINTYQFVKDNSGNNNQETQKQKLATPVLTGYANETVTWNAVENASGYIVRINGVEYNVYTTTYVITFDNSCSFTVQVKAIPNTGSEKYLDSEWSTVYSYQYIMNNQVDKDNYENYLKYKLGFGINIITAEYLDSNAITSNTLLDIEKLSEMYNVLQGQASDTSIHIVEGTSYKEFSNNVSGKYTNGAHASLDVKVGEYGFGTTFKNEISITENFKITSKTKQYYHLAYQNIIDKRMSIHQFNSNEISRDNILSKGAIIDLNEIMKETDQTKKEKLILVFFDTYGTHIIRDAIYGGKVEVLFYLLTNDESFDYNLIKNYTDSFDVKLNIGDVSIEEGTSTKLNNAIEKSVLSGKTISNFTARLVGVTGGISMNTNNMSVFYEACDKWINDYNSQTQKNTMIGIVERGLCPVWQLLPSEYSGLKDLMKEVFDARLSLVNNEFEEKFEYEIDKTREFSGGTGTADDPYLIEAPEQLKLINNYLDNRNVYFKLIKSFEIEGSWIPIGSYIREENQYFDHYFRGHFDGNGNTIKYEIDITKDFRDLDLCYYYGLFGAIRYATIENLNITANIKTVDYVPEKEYIDIPSNYHPEELAAGAIAGFSSDCEINNCSTTVDTNITMMLGYGGERHWVIAGGLVGVAVDELAIKNCKTSGTISTASYKPVSGGLVGWTEDDDFIGSSSDATLSSKKIFVGDVIVGTGHYGKDYGYLD